MVVQSMLEGKQYHCSDMVLPLEPASIDRANGALQRGLMTVMNIDVSKLVH